MKKYILFFVASLLCMDMAAQKTPKAVEKARESMASVMTFRNGTLVGSGTAFFTGEKGEALSSYSLFMGADSAVVVDTKGKVHNVERVMGVNEMFNCIKFRVAYDKKIKPLALSSAPVTVGEPLYMLSYGIKKSGAIDAVEVQKTDSAYSYPYYTLGRPASSDFVSLPLVNGEGELVAVMQPSSQRDTLRCYAVGSGLASALVPKPINYGRGYYPSMGIRTALPSEKEAALSCLYMQAMIGDSVSYGKVLEDFMSAFPKCYEGYVSKAEYVAVYQRNIAAAEEAWNEALSLSKNDAEVYFNKAKVLSSILQSGDTLYAAMVSHDNAFASIDKAIELDRQPLYVNYKADMLYSRGDYSSASELYEELAKGSMHTPDIFLKASQCQGALKNYDRSIELLDSAINCFGDTRQKEMAPYLLVRAVVKMTAQKYREAVFDYNEYEKIMSPNLNASFYYMRQQAELNGKMYQQALNDIENAIYLDPTNAMYYVEKGVLCYRVKLFDEGIRALESAGKLAPASPDIYYLSGLIYVQTGDKAKAKECFEKAVSLGHPQAADALKGL